MSARSTAFTEGGWDFNLHSSTSNVGLVLVHEIFGRDDYIESVASKLADSGFWASTVDLFRGKHAASLEEGFQLRAALTDTEAVNALGSGLKLLNEKIGKDPKVGSMGFCMGGGYALLGACNLNINFCVDYYGSIQNVEQVQGLSGPVLLLLGSEDERVTPWAYQQFLPAATKFRKRIDMHLYPNARHAFHRPDWEGHNPDAAKDAWAKTLNFLSQFKK